MDHRDHHRAPDETPKSVVTFTPGTVRYWRPVLSHIGGDGCAEGHENGGYHALNLTGRAENPAIYTAPGVTAPCTMMMVPIAVIYGP